MNITFGLGLDQPALPEMATPRFGVRRLGPQGFLKALEQLFGSIGVFRPNPYLRIEQYRQRLKAYLQEHPNAFFASSFSADSFACAADLLDRRDELLLGGWDFISSQDCPERLELLTHLEADLDQHDFQAGFADRFRWVESVLPFRKPAFEAITIIEPEALTPAHWKRLLESMAARGVHIRYGVEKGILSKQSDLSRFQNYLLEGRQLKEPAKADGSLLMLKARRDTDLAAYLAALLKKNPGFQPALLIPDRSTVLDHTLSQEGMPGLGLQSASLARPSLQTLKLVTAFLWRPVDPIKLLEFVSLSVKPLEEELSRQIARQIASRPGLKSDGWHSMIKHYFQELEKRVERDRSLDPRKIENQYRFWFERTRYPQGGRAPKQEVLELFRYLNRWAQETFDHQSEEQSSLLLLAELSRQLVELLEAQTEDQLSRLDLERAVRAVFDASPVRLYPEQRGRLPYTTDPGNFIEPVDQLVWWNFNRKEPDYFFSRWYAQERHWLEQRNIQLDYPAEKNQRLLHQRTVPVLSTKNQLLLLSPEVAEGQDTLPHPLLSELEACFADLGPITLDITLQLDRKQLQQFFHIPEFQTLPMHPLPRPEPFVRIKQGNLLSLRPRETFSSLEDLCYYPHKWVFRHKAQLRPASILSRVRDSALMGNLAHRLFENLFSREWEKWSLEDTHRWVEEYCNILFEREGSVMLQYGREPERVAFIRKMQEAGWAFINLLKENGWRVLASESKYEGPYLDGMVTGIIDMVLGRAEERAVIDLKWRGKTRYSTMLKNAEDLQLALYAHLLSKGDQWAHTAYFLLSEGLLLTRNQEAFSNVEPVDTPQGHWEVQAGVLDRMEKTLNWRRQQLLEGKIEIRCESTLAELELSYGETLLNVLEMKHKDAPYDDYRTLIGL